MILTGISIAIASLLVLFSVLLWSKKLPTQRADRFLGLAFLLMAILNFSMLFVYTVHIQHQYSLLTWYFPLEQVLIMFIGPSIYYYVQLLFDRSRPLLPRQMLLHALPALPALVYVVYFVMLPFQVRLGMLIDDADPRHWMDDALDSLFYFQSIPYLFICFGRVNKQRTSNYVLRANGFQTDVRWLHQFLVLSLVGLLIYVPLSFGLHATDYQIGWGATLIALLCICILLQSFFGMELCMHHSVVIPREPARRLKLDEKQIEEYLQIIHQAVVIDQLYLLPDCSVEMVSNKTNIPWHHISHVLNVHFDTSFTDFVNKQRCNHARTLLEAEESQNFTLETIGMMSGFGGRSNFNRVFKNDCGITPSKYLSRQNRN